MKHLFAVAAAAAVLTAGQVVADTARAADVRTAGAPGIALTVYNNDLGLVRDVRAVDLQNGTHEIRFDDVAARIDPTSVHFQALDHPDQVTLQEQNFQYDLADADRLLSRYLNRSVTVVMKDGSSLAGTLLSFDGANVVIQGDGGVKIINRNEVKTVTLGELPGGLVVKPTLVWTVDSGHSGREQVEVSYLTNGISWHAEYVAVVNPEDTKLDLTGWVSIDNQSGATYDNAKLKLVAGDVHMVQPPPQPYAGRLMKDMETMAAPQFTQESFFEYHLYTLDHPATVRDRETKQLSLFPTANASALKKMRYDGQRRPTDVVVSLEVANSKANGLGMPLPKGKIRVYKQSKDGGQEFVGEDQIDHTATDEKVRLTLGNAFDVVGERTETDHQRINDHTQQTSVKVEIRNHKTEPVTVSVVEHIPGTDWDITEHSHNFNKTDAHTIEFPVTVPAGGSVVVTYTARYQI